jgi:hypothetical protein
LDVGDWETGRLGRIIDADTFEEVRRRGDWPSTVVLIGR